MEPIRISQALEKIAGRNTTRGKFSLRVEITNPVTITPDVDTAMQLLADTLTQQFRDSFMRGDQPGGGALPSAAPMTVVRRDYRLKQAQRGGQAHQRYGRGKQSGYPKARNNYRKRFRAPKLGLIPPGSVSVPQGVVGVESSLLAKSALAVVEKGTKGRARFRVFFANPRALVDKAGTSAVDRVFRKLGAGRVWLSDRTLHKYKRTVGKLVTTAKSAMRLINATRNMVEQFDQSNED